jgi:hypothetical protein
MVAAHNGVWVSQQLVRDLNHGELLVDDMGSVEKVLDTLGFEHTTWQVPKQQAATPTGQDYSSHAALFAVWMKQSIAQGRVPIFGAKTWGEADAAYDHIMPMYSVQFWSADSSSTFGTSQTSGSSGSGGNRTYGGYTTANNSSTADVKQPTVSSLFRAHGFVFDAATGYHVPQQLMDAIGALWTPAAASEDENTSEEDNEVDSEDYGQGNVSDDEDIWGDEVHQDDLKALPDDAIVLNAATRPAPNLYQGHTFAQVPRPASRPAETGSRTEGLQSAQLQWMDPSGRYHATGWLPPPTQNPALQALDGLYAFSGADMFTWTNDYGQEITKAVGTAGLVADRSSCRMSDIAGGCISRDSPSYAVAMGGLVQPAAVEDTGAAAGTTAAGTAAAGTAAALMTPVAVDAMNAVAGAVGAGAAAPIGTAAAAEAAGGFKAEQGASAAVSGLPTLQTDQMLPDVSLAPADTLFRPLRLTVVAWSKVGWSANAEPYPKFRASAVAYDLDVSRCAAKGTPFTLFRFDGISAFRSTGAKDSLGRAVLANPSSVQELGARCMASKAACRWDTFVQAESLKVGAKDFGPFRAYGATYFVCVAGAVQPPGTVQQA